MFYATIIVGMLWGLAASGCFQWLFDLLDRPPRLSGSQKDQSYDFDAECESMMERLFAALTDGVNSKIDVLARKYRASVYTDEYGVRVTNSWMKEFQYFWSSVLNPIYESLIDSDPMIEDLFGREDAFAYIYERTTKHLEEQFPSLHSDDVPTDPWEFERHCANILTRNGWDASVTRGSGDQGADVIALKEGRTLVIQCKLHRAAVGNKAVQEAFAALAHYSANEAAVVSTSGYTASARALAGSTGVKLLHVEELNSF